MAAVRVASTDGVTLAVHDLGGAGPTLLLCHATGFHGMVMAPLAAALSSRFRVVALDFRGHGGSGRPPVEVGYGWSGFGDDVLATVAALAGRPDIGPGPVLAMGHSMGGATLFLAEQFQPGTFAGLYCFEPIVFPPGAGPAEGGDDHLVEASRRRRQVFASRDEAYANFAAKAPLSALTPDALRAYVDHGFVDCDDGTVTLACRREDEADIYRMAPPTAPTRGSGRWRAPSPWPPAPTAAPSPPRPPPPSPPASRRAGPSCSTSSATSVHSRTLRWWPSRW